MMNWNEFEKETKDDFVDDMLSALWDDLFENLGVEYEDVGVAMVDVLEMALAKAAEE